jgi:hypothetical protein
MKPAALSLSFAAILLSQALLLALLFSDIYRETTARESSGYVELAMLVKGTQL